MGESRMTVAIVMGSDSDEPIMREAAEALDEFGIEWQMRILSAHRTPDDAIAFARSAKQNGVSVLIAGAGGAAHLAGVLAAATPLPVIGVPIPLKTMSGLDSLLSMAQMPRGVPVATVAIGGARNAGLLAARIIGISDERVGTAVVDFQEKLAAEVRAKDAALQERLSK